MEYYVGLLIQDYYVQWKSGSYFIKLQCSFNGVYTRMENRYWRITRKLIFFASVHVQNCIKSRHTALRIYVLKLENVIVCQSYLL